jgi:hypothetical protein
VGPEQVGQPGGVDRAVLTECTVGRAEVAQRRAPARDDRNRHATVPEPAGQAEQRRGSPRSCRAGHHERRPVLEQVHAHRVQLAAPDTDQPPQRGVTGSGGRRGEHLAERHAGRHLLDPERAQLSRQFTGPRRGLPGQPPELGHLGRPAGVGHQQGQLRLERAVGEWHQRPPGRHMLGYVPRPQAAQRVVHRVGHPQDQPARNQRADPTGEQRAVTGEHGSQADRRTIPKQLEHGVHRPPVVDAVVGLRVNPSQPSTNSTSHGSRSSGGAAARCSATEPNPDLASSSCRRATSASRRASDPPERTGRASRSPRSGVVR